MAEPIDIMIFVEHVARELDTACAIKYLLAQRHGLKTHIASMAWDLGGTLRDYKPAVVVTPYCYSVADFGIHQILAAWPDAHYVNLAYEQVFQQIQKGHKAPRDRFAFECVLHHAWGEFYASFLAASGVRKENIVVNGNPTYALYLPPYHSYFESRQDLAVKHHLDPAKRWVLVPENYGVGFLNDQQLATRYGNKADWEKGKEFRRFAFESFNQAARWWAAAARRDNVEVIVRPRPATPEEVFGHQFAQAAGEAPANLHIIKKGTVREWILAADLVASSYSTTLIESAVASKPIVMFAPIAFPAFVSAEWYPLVPNVVTEEAFVQAAAGQGPPDSFKPLQDWARRTMLSGGDVIANLADLLASVKNKTRPLPGPPGAGVRSLRPPETLRKRVRGLLCRVKHAFIGRPGRSWEADEIVPADVQRRVDKWARVLEHPQH